MSPQQVTCGHALTCIVTAAATGGGATQACTAHPRGRKDGWATFGAVGTAGLQLLLWLWGFGQVHILSLPVCKMSDDERMTRVNAQRSRPSTRAGSLEPAPPMTSPMGQPCRFEPRDAGPHRQLEGHSWASGFSDKWPFSASVARSLMSHAPAWEPGMRLLSRGSPSLLFWGLLSTILAKTKWQPPLK